jgi:predicted RNA binding protein YcfA (HicA-like mRNA interferase family)
MPKELTAVAFKRALRKLGFVEVRRAGSHVLARHPGTGLVVTFSDQRGKIPRFVARAIVKQIENYHIASRDELAQKFGVQP